MVRIWSKLVHMRTCVSINQYRRTIRDNAWHINDHQRFNFHFVQQPTWTKTLLCPDIGVKPGWDLPGFFSKGQLTVVIGKSPFSSPIISANPRSSHASCSPPFGPMLNCTFSSTATCVLLKTIRFLVRNHNVTGTSEPIDGDLFEPTTTSAKFRLRTPILLGTNF